MSQNAEPPDAGYITPLIRFLRIIGPFTTAWVITRWQYLFVSFADKRPAFVPIALVALLCCLLVGTFRHLLLGTLAFGIAFLALHDAAKVTSLPQTLDIAYVRQVLPGIWISVVFLAALSGIGIGWNPYAVWSRRAYFAATALYLFCHGLMGFLGTHDWGSAVILFTSIAAVGGVLFARRLVIDESTMESEYEDMREQRTQEEERARAVEATEWHEPQPPALKGA